MVMEFPISPPYWFKANPIAREDELQRALIVLLGRDKEKFILAGTNDKIIHCKGCGGVKERVGISIKKGVIVVEPNERLPRVCQ